MITSVISSKAEGLDQNKWLNSEFRIWCEVYSRFSLIGGSDYKLIYRHYATLYFVFCVDSSESELGILDLIQVSIQFHSFIVFSIDLSSN